VEKTGHHVESVDDVQRPLSEAAAGDLARHVELRGTEWKFVEVVIMEATA